MAGQQDDALDLGALGDALGEALGDGDALGEVEVALDDEGALTETTYPVE